ncbi:MAG: response regulator [Chloroflexota bacterium]|nr:response regulator [Chloroflexota bacterium]
MAGTIRVLIVDDVQESRDNVERLLKFESDIEIVGTASRGQEAIEFALAKRPDIILMDVNMPDMDGITATRTILSQLPAIGVIMMSVLNEPDVLRRSMTAGAREYLVKPFSLDELLDGIRTVHANAPKIQMQQVVSPESGAAVAAPVRQAGKGVVICVAGVKGGSGRSMIAANLAVAIRQQSQQRVALVDANIAFGDIGVMMNVSDSKTMLDAVPYLRQVDTELINNIVVEHGSGIHLLLAPPSPQEAEVVTPDLVKSLVSVMTGMFDIVIVDTRPSFDDLNLAVFDAADLLLLVVTMDMTSIKDARQFLEVTELLGYPEDRLRLVLNRSNTYSGIPAAEIGESLRKQLWARIPDEPGPVLRSVNEGVPLVSSSNDSKVVEEINRMARDILSYVNPDAAIAGVQGAQRTGLVRKLLGGRVAH